MLYYVLVMQPREAERYDQLRQSVASLGEIIESQQSLLTRGQASRLEDLYVLAMGSEVAGLIVSELRDNTSEEELAKKIEDQLVFQTRLLEGLRRKGQSAISEAMAHKIRNSRISQDVARKAIAEYTIPDIIIS